MRGFSKFAAGLAAFTMIAGTTSTPALAGDIASAEKLRKLDIMLMVTALRCRHSADGFQADYYNFSAKHNKSLNSAAHEMQSNLEREYGPAGAKRALDKLSVGMANRYGQGHPSMNCAQLKAATQELAQQGDYASLVAAADRMLAPDTGHVMLAARN